MKTPSPNLNTVRISTHYLSSNPKDCPFQSCIQNFNTRSLTTATRIVNDTLVVSNASTISKQRWLSLVLRNRLAEGRRKRWKREKAWMKCLMRVEKRTDKARALVYGSLGDLRWLRGRYAMPNRWREAVRQLHFAKAELGGLKARLDGFDCL